MAWNKNVNTNAPSKSVFANLLKVGVAISSCAILFACGDDVTNESITQIVQENMAVVADVSKLPDCSSENEGQQALVKGEPSPRICVDGKWFATFSDYTDKLDDFKCSAEKLKDGSGLKILCNGDSIGVVLNGSSGVNGAQGIQGEKGDKGDTGAQGIQGEKGDKGDTGAQGIQGEKGDKGDTGAQGIQGEKGDKGDTGAQGIQGEKGDTGADGTGCVMEMLEDGSGLRVLCNDDSVGVLLNGAKGEKGDRGYQGLKGDKGEKGDKGNAGESCSIDRADNIILITCGNENAMIDINELNELIENSSSSSNNVITYSVTDSRDNQTYKTVTIGSQTWMAENLNFETPNSYCYKNSYYSCSVYGRLYTWSAAMDSAGIWSSNGKGCGDGNKTCSPKNPVRGVCPEGWHLPNSAEFETLFDAVGGKKTGGKMLKSTSGWNDDYGIGGNGIDAYGFSGLPSGERDLDASNGSGYGLGYYASFWTSTGSYSSAYYMHLYYNTTGDHGEGVSLAPERNLSMAYSIRCIKN